MRDSKYRIPKMAMAVMVLGGCGDDDGGSPSARVDKVGKTLCRLVFSCEGGDFGYDPNDPSITFSTEQECLDQFTRELKATLATVSAKCRDAYLSYYECYVGSGCEVDEAGCERAYTTYTDACKGEL